MGMRGSASLYKFFTALHRPLWRNTSAGCVEEKDYVAAARVRETHASAAKIQFLSLSLFLHVFREKKERNVKPTVLFALCEVVRIS